MQEFSVGTCLGDAFEALAQARRSILLVLAAASPLIAAAIYVLSTERIPLPAAALLPVLDVVLATIVSVAVFAELYDRPVPAGRILIAALRRALSAAFVMALIYLVVLAIGFVAAMPLLDGDRWRHDLGTGAAMLALWMFLSSILYTRWFVAIPASVIEFRRPVAALRRSDQLTRGHRAALFAILALLGTIAGGTVAVLEVRISSDAVIFALTLLGWIPLSVIRAAISATAYAQLRAATEAGDPERLGEVFA